MGQGHLKRHPDDQPIAIRRSGDQAIRRSGMHVHKSCHADSISAIHISLRFELEHGTAIRPSPGAWPGPGGSDIALGDQKQTTGDGRGSSFAASGKFKSILFDILLGHLTRLTSPNCKAISFIASKTACWLFLGYATAGRVVRNALSLSSL